MATKRPAGKTAKEKAEGKAPQSNGVVKVGKKTLKKWDLNAAPSGKSPAFKKFKTNHYLKQFIEDQLANGKLLKSIAADLGVTSARVWEMTHQLGIDVNAQKARATVPTEDKQFRADLKTMEANNKKYFGGKKVN